MTWSSRSRSAAALASAHPNNNPQPHATLTYDPPSPGPLGAPRPSWWHHQVSAARTGPARLLRYQPRLPLFDRAALHPAARLARDHRLLGRHQCHPVPAVHLRHDVRPPRALLPGGPRYLRKHRAAAAPSPRGIAPHLNCLSPLRRRPAQSSRASACSSSPSRRPWTSSSPS